MACVPSPSVGRTAPRRTRSGSAALAGVKPAAGGEGAGFQLKVPLPRQTERLRLWVSAYEGTGVLTASVPGLPAATNTEMVGKTNDHGGVFEIDVQGTGDLTVTFVLTCPQAGGCTPDSHVTMYAAAYTWTGEPPSFSVNVTPASPPTFTVVQGDTTARTSKVTTTAINPPLTQVALSTSVTTAAGEPGTGLSATVSPATVSTFPATSDVTIIPAVGIATGTYHVTVAGIETDGATDVNTANFTVTVLPRTQVPFLYRAFPNDDGGVSVEGVMHGSPNQTYRIQFSTATACSAGRTPGGVVTTPAGPVIEIATDASGDAYHRARHRHSARCQVPHGTRHGVPVCHHARGDLDAARRHRLRAVHRGQRSERVVAHRGSNRHRRNRGVPVR